MSTSYGYQIDGIAPKRKGWACKVFGNTPKIMLNLHWTNDTVLEKLYLRIFQSVSKWTNCRNKMKLALFQLCSECVIYKVCSGTIVCVIISFPILGFGTSTISLQQKINQCDNRNIDACSSAFLFWKKTVLRLQQPLGFIIVYSVSCKLFLFAFTKVNCKENLL